MFSKNKNLQPHPQGPVLTVPTERESENLETRLYNSKILTAEINFENWQAEQFLDDTRSKFRKLKCLWHVNFI